VGSGVMSTGGMMGEVGTDKAGEKTEAGDVGTVRVGLGAWTGTNPVPRDEAAASKASVNTEGGEGF